MSKKDDNQNSGSIPNITTHDGVSDVYTAPGSVPPTAATARSGPAQDASSRSNSAGGVTAHRQPGCSIRRIRKVKQPGFVARLADDSTLQTAQPFIAAEPGRREAWYPKALETRGVRLFG